MSKEFANLNNVSNEVAIERLKKMEENSCKYQQLRAQGDEILNKVRKEGETGGSTGAQAILFFVLLAVFSPFVIKFQLGPTYIVLGIVIIAAITSLLTRGPRMNKKQRQEYETRLKEAEAEKKRLYEEAGRLYKENEKTLHIPLGFSTPKRLKDIRMLLESGQANNLEVAIYMCEKDTEREKALLQMQTQMNWLQNDVDNANRRAEAAERYARYHS